MKDLSDGREINQSDSHLPNDNIQKDSKYNISIDEINNYNNSIAEMNSSLLRSLEKRNKSKLKSDDKILLKNPSNKEVMDSTNKKN